jgi:hypothetical protein
MDRVLGPHLVYKPRKPVYKGEKIMAGYGENGENTPLFLSPYFISIYIKEFVRSWVRRKYGEIRRKYQFLRIISVISPFAPTD